MVLLTATLPPSCEAELQRRIGWSLLQVRLFRTPTSRGNIGYYTRQVDKKGKAIQQYAEMVQEILGEYPSGKAVVYYNAVRQTINLAKVLDCYIFYYTATDKIIVLQQFRSEGRTIIATSIFRIGIDITDIRLIVYIGWPRILLDYAQESGRAGRDRLKSEAIIIIRESQFAEPGEALVDRLVDSFVKG